MNVVKKRYPILDENGQPSAYPTFASQVFFKDGSNLESKNLVVDPLTAYPVGSIYLSVNNVSPASLFGGTWEQLKDRFLLGAGGSYSAGATGGATAHQHQYGFQYNAYHGFIALEGSDASVAGLLSYNTSNGITMTGGGTQNGSGTVRVNGNVTNSNYNAGANAYRMVANTSHVSNVPPYLAVYMWKRVE